MLREPLAPNDARRLIRQVFDGGSVVFSKHARQEMVKDRIEEQDISAVLRGGVVEPAELEHGTWRYRLRAGDVYVVVAFRSESELIVVTAWRK